MGWDVGSYIDFSLHVMHNISSTALDLRTNPFNIYLQKLWYPTSAGTADAVIAMGNMQCIVPMDRHVCNSGLVHLQQPPCSKDLLMCGIAEGTDNPQMTAAALLAIGCLSRCEVAAQQLVTQGHVRSLAGTLEFGAAMEHADLVIGSCMLVSVLANTKRTREEWARHVVSNSHLIPVLAQVRLSFSGERCLRSCVGALLEHLCQSAHAPPGANTARASLRPREQSLPESWILTSYTARAALIMEVQGSTNQSSLLHRDVLVPQWPKVLDQV
jgi:hypothetical protein